MGFPASEARRRVFAAATAVLAFAILVSAPNASGQSVADQYVPSITPAGAGGEVVPTQRNAESPAASTPTAAVERKLAAAAASETADPGDAGGVELPGGGFPLGTFGLAVALLVVAGLVGRLLLPVLRHRA